MEITFGELNLQDLDGIRNKYRHFPPFLVAKTKSCFHCYPAFLLKS